eukprot:905915-Alexandrium_andersonii.AAC.1
MDPSDQCGIRRAFAAHATRAAGSPAGPGLRGQNELHRSDRWQADHCPCEGQSILCCRCGLGQAGGGPHIAHEQEGG